MKLRFSFKQFILSCLLIIGSLLLIVNQTRAQECEEFNCSEDNEECLKNKKICLENAIAGTRQQATTLKSAISLLNGQIALQQLQVNQTQAEIYQLEIEIEELSQRIEGLGYSLDRLGTVLIERVRTQYKQSRSAPSLSLLGANSLSDLVTQARYLLLAQRQTADTMERTETQRLAYDEQKTLKEEKQAELATKRQQLEAEKAIITQKRTEQENLLNITNNSEQQYQSLLNEANRQLAAFSRFVTSQGGASILSGQTYNDDGWGKYYSQRDSLWGNKGIGASGSSMAEYGCLVTSMAMVTSHYGKDLTPGQIADSTSPFVFPTAYMIQGTWNVNGVSTTRTRVGYSVSTLDSELSAGRPVIVGIGSGPDHFIVIKEKKDGNYIMHDPFMPDGANRPLTDKYSVSDISTLRLVSFN